MPLQRTSVGRRSAWQPFLRNPGAVGGALIILLLVLMAISAPLVAPYNPLAQDPNAVLQGPSLHHLLGADALGRDILSRIMYGARISLFIGVASVLVGVLAGGSLGVIGGFYGGLLDDTLMRTMDVLLAIPGIILALAIVAAVGPSLQGVILAVGISTIPGDARLTRSQTLYEREIDYVAAARVAGANDGRIMGRHILPNILGVLVVKATTDFGAAILTAAGLSFLGLGVPPPTPTWGGMVSDGRQFIFTAPHIGIIPGLFIMLAVLAFNLAGDGLRDVLDPRSKVRSRGS